MIYVEPDDGRYDTDFDQVCLYGHEECSDVWGGSCTQPTGLAKAEQNVLSIIERYPDGVCTPHIVKVMLNSGLSEGALSVTKRIANLRKAGFPVHGGIRDSAFCQQESHRHHARVGLYLLDI